MSKGKTIKKRPRGRQVKLVDVLCFLHNILTAADTEVDADRTADQVVRFLSEYTVWFSTEDLERYLYFCNMNYESNKFVDAMKRSFPIFHKAVVPKGCYFDRKYNVIEVYKNGKAD